MNQKVQELARTLVQSGIAASESEAMRMAESMVNTEQKVQTDFDGKRERETMYGKSPRTPPRVNPVDGTPITPVSEQNENKRDMSIGEVKNPHMSPEEYSAARLNVAKSTSELIEEEKMNSSSNQENYESKPVAEVSQTENSEEEVKDQEIVQEEVTKQNSEPVVEGFNADDLEIPKPEDPVESSEENTRKELPNLNPLEEDKNENDSVQNSPNNSSEESELPKTQTPERKPISDEEKQKMEESKVDLSKIFKV